MLILSREDFFEVYLKSIISDYDRDTLTLLYQPIIGADAVSLYLSLYAEFKKSKKQDAFNQHADLSLSMGFTTEQIIEARRKLEAVGLLETYYREEKNNGFYKYLLYAPKTPKQFFDDALFKGLLIEKLSEKKVQELIRKYKEKPLDLKGYEDVTASFVSVFKINKDSTCFINKDTIDGFDRKSIDVSTKEFSLDVFTNILRDNYSVLTQYLSKTDLNKVSKLALLYGVNETTCADYFVECYKNKKLDVISFENKLKEEKNFVFLKNEITSTNSNIDTNSKIGKKIALCSNTSPLDYLKIKQRSNAIPDSDALLIKELIESYNLPFGVINVIIDYSLTTCNNMLKRAYVTKIASTIQREGIDNVLDCMNFFKLEAKRRKNTYSKTYSKNDTKNNNSNETKSNEEEITDSELYDMIEGL